ncbi:MAG TPA: hypothetical protein VH682_14500 [Gemmataceae bacterium]
MTVLCLAGGVGAASAALPGRNSIVQTFRDVVGLDRTQSAALLGGVCCGGVAALALLGWAAGRQRLLAGLLHVGVVAVFSLLLLKEVLSPYLANPDQTSSPSALVERPVVLGFKIEEVAKLSIMPTCLAVGPDEELYVAGYAGIAYRNGVIHRLHQSAQSGPLEEIRVADSLNRPHGLAFYKGDLYVSRAGQYTRAEKGRIVEIDTGSVTRLRDLDGDGVYDNYTDVVTGLPGAQNPDGLHQNNGITFSRDFLYVTVGTPSDHGPPNHRYAGTIVRARPDGSELAIFAQGLRNPFGIAVGPGEQVFCTDNDADFTNPGDALYHVVEGDHFGHPYNAVSKSITVAGAKAPLLRSRSALEGLAYAPPGSLPLGYDDCLYVAAYGDGHLKRVRLRQEGQGYSTEMDFFAKIPGVLGVAVSPKERAIYACSHENKKIYRITPE